METFPSPKKYPSCSGALFPIISLTLQFEQCPSPASWLLLPSLTSVGFWLCLLLRVFSGITPLLCPIIIRQKWQVSITSHGEYLIVMAASFSIFNRREVLRSFYPFEKCLAPSMCRLVRVIEKMHRNPYEVDDAYGSSVSRQPSVPTISLCTGTCYASSLPGTHIFCIIDLSNLCKNSSVMSFFHWPSTLKSSEGPSYFLSKHRDIQLPDHSTVPRNSAYQTTPRGHSVSTSSLLRYLYMLIATTMPYAIKIDLNIAEKAFSSSLYPVLVVPAHQQLTCHPLSK